MKMKRLWIERQEIVFFSMQTRAQHRLNFIFTHQYCESEFNSCVEIPSIAKMNKTHV